MSCKHQWTYAVDEVRGCVKCTEVQELHSKRWTTTRPGLSLSKDLTAEELGRAFIANSNRVRERRNK